MAVAVAGHPAGDRPAATLRTAHNTAVGRTIVVDPQRRTLYRLPAETARHLLCRASCLGSWIPLTVSSGRTKLEADARIHGRVGLLRRRGGRLQVTLRASPLYRFSGDRRPGEARGDGIDGPGGGWRVVPPRRSTPLPPAAPGPVPGPKLPPIPPPA